jgi:hypothetical protein
MSWQPSAAAGIVFIFACLLGSLIIELRRHYLRRDKAMHLRIAALMADKTDQAETNRAEQQDHNRGHRGISFDA